MRIRHAIQQYGGIAESLIHAFLSFAPVAAGPGDTEAERTFQLIQSISDMISLREDKYLHPGATDVDVCSALHNATHKIVGFEVHFEGSQMFPVVGRNAVKNSSSIRRPIRDD